MVAELINSRREEMTERQYLVPAPAPQRYPLWPLADYFPAALAIATARAAGEVDTKNAINFTRRAITCAQTNSDPRFVRTWRGVANAIRRERKRIALRESASTFLWFVNITAAMLATGILLLGAFSVNMGIDKASRKPFFIDLTPLQACMGYARQALEHLDRQYPREVTGLARLFPWNWGAEDPKFPTKMEGDLYAGLTQLASPYTFRSGLSQLTLHAQEDITNTAPTMDWYASCDEAAKIFTDNFIISSAPPHYRFILGFYFFVYVKAVALYHRSKQSRRSILGPPRNIGMEIRHHNAAFIRHHFTTPSAFIRHHFTTPSGLPATIPALIIALVALSSSIIIILPYYLNHLDKPYMATFTVLLLLSIRWAYGKPFAVGWRFAYGFKDETP